MDSFAARDSAPAVSAGWARMAVHWRDLARQADWQDRYAVRLS